MLDTDHRPSASPWPEQPTPEPAGRGLSPWIVLGCVLAVAALVAGLALLAVLIAASSSAAIFGSNK